MADTDLSKLAASLSEAQRIIMLGQIIDIPPHEADALEELGLKETAYFYEPGDDRRLIWPITPLGLQLRRYLQEINRGD